ncbi:MAG: hypothetical protein Kow00120_05260 [Anaerolineae bacterium]
MTIKVHFTEDDWARIARDWAAWWAHDLDRPLVVLIGKEGSEVAYEAFASNFPLDMPAEAVIDHYQRLLEARRFYGDAWPRWWPNFGPGIMAGFLGATVHSVPDTVWFSPARQEPISDLRLTYDPDNVWWRRVSDVTRVAVARWGDQVTVGHTDLGGNLDVLASMRDTQQLLFDLHDAPCNVARLVDEITHLWLHYYDALYAIIRQAGRGTTPWAAIWSPGRCYMLQCDFAYMISPEMFERLVMPYLAACCDALDHGFYHLDGKGQLVHLDMLLSLERLRGIQWVPGDGAPPPEKWLGVLKRIRDAGKLCQLYVSAEGARTIVRQLGGRGFAFGIHDTMTRAEADDFLRALAAEDAEA